MSIHSFQEQWRDAFNAVFMQLLTLKVEKVIFTIVVAATLLQSRYMWVTLKGLRKTRGKKVYFVNCMEWLQIYGYLLALSYVKFQV